MKFRMPTEFPRLASHPNGFPGVLVVEYEPSKYMRFDSGDLVIVPNRNIPPGGAFIEADDKGYLKALQSLAKRPVKE